MKSTMKKSPIKQGFMAPNAAAAGIKKVTEAIKARKVAKETPVSKNGIKEKAIASRAADKKAKPVVEGKPNASTNSKTALAQLKKHKR